MNENEIRENETKDYEAPEVFELGQAGELTQGRIFGDWPDGLDNRFTFAP
jgi:hypothetical protein